MIRKVFPILALSVFSSLLGAGIVVPLLPLYARSMGATGIWLGIIVASFSVANIISIPFFGRLSDKIGRKKILASGLLFYGSIALAYILAQNVYQLSLVRLCQGAAGGMIIPIAQAYIGDVCPEGEEGRWMGYTQAAFFMGFGVGPLMGGLLTEHYGMSAAFISMSALNLFAFVVVLLFLPEVHDRRAKAKVMVPLRELAGNNLMRGLFSFRMSFAFGRAAVMVFLPIIAADALGLGTGDIGILLAAHIVLTSLLGLPSGRFVADRFNKRNLVVMGALLNIAFVVLIPQAGTFGTLLALSFLGSLGGALSMPAGTALVVQVGRYFGMGSTLAAYNLAFSVGQAVGPIVIGGIRDLVGLNSVFYFGAMMVTFGTVIFYFFSRRT